jgi:3-oxo-5-alpha-steroid 4-dehydrogenase 1
MHPSDVLCPPEIAYFSWMVGPSRRVFTVVVSQYIPGINSWIVMELVSPLSFAYTLVTSPLSISVPPASLAHPATLLSALYILHYLNRSLISPFRISSRSKSHISVPLSAISFNVVNGCLMGTYLSSPSARSFLANAYSRPSFYVGLTLWALGFAGNIIHDEILLNIRRKSKAKGKVKDLGQVKEGTGTTEYYGIPHGLLYEYISYPNYFCEWIEWLGFAIAAAPIPELYTLPPSSYSSSLSPPYIFLLSEVLLMFPRAWKGHKWYHARFPEYPARRKAVIPFII